MARIADSPDTFDDPPTATVALPAACGELVQGSLDGVRCLVSCPIDWYNGARVTLRPGPDWTVPGDAPKAAAALSAGLAHLDVSGRGGRLRLFSDLPRGRGYASSTVDVGATLYGLAQALGRPLSAAEAARLAVAVEPSDSTLFPGLTLFDHRRGSLHRCLGPAPPLAVVGLDPGGQVDTLAFNRQDHRQVLRRLAPCHHEAFTLLIDGLRAGDWPTIGAAATLSARAHQALLPNPLLETALGLADQVGALGLCRAHSGTVLGLLLDPLRVDVHSAATYVARRLPRSVTVTRFSLVDGGPRYGVEGHLSKGASMTKEVPSYGDGFRDSSCV